MALKSPLIPSPTGTGLSSSFSPYSDSPNSPARFGNQFSGPSSTQSNRSSGQTDSLAPPASPYPPHIDPSPVDSNGTEGTEIEEGAQEGIKASSAEASTEDEDSNDPLSDIEITSPAVTVEPRPKLDTQVSDRHRSGSADDGPQSVIHVPAGFRDFDSDKRNRRSTGSQAERTLASPSTPEAIDLSADNKKRASISPVNTDLPAYMDRSTPRAHTKQEVDDEHNKRKSGRTSSLEDIPESLDKNDNENAETLSASPAVLAPEANEDESRPSTQGTVTQGDDEIDALRTALSECWTLCNTLAGLSSSHRTRTFKFTDRTEVQEQAWRSCWRLCQQLYDHKDEDHASQVAPTLELCRDFCQSLFDARQRVDEASDSVLRVSFELNNHLYNTHGKTIPEAFNERTLDFYITLCHRLMKQRTSLPEETDSLLRACWSLAEMLFNLRQSTREGKPADEELLGSAVQACWELCDLFREGWTQVRPDRGTPRPSQTTFGSQTAGTFRSGSSASGGGRSSSTLSGRKYHEAVSFPPETPVTIFDDTSTAESSPDVPTVPNILVLGPASSANTSTNTLTRSSHERWSSGTSSMSDEYSESAGSTNSSQRTSSTATASGEDAQLLRLRCLLLKAALNTGYTRTSSQHLPAYVKAMPENAFGSQPWKMKVLTFYRKLVTNDKSMQTVHSLPPQKLTASEAARAVRWLGNSEQWAWMRDLFRIVFGFGVEEAERRGGVVQI